MGSGVAVSFNRVATNCHVTWVAVSIVLNKGQCSLSGCGAGRYAGTRCMHSHCLKNGIIIQLLTVTNNHQPPFYRQPSMNSGGFGAYGHFLYMHFHSLGLHCPRIEAE
jgi:hypothetical protein